VSAAAGSHHIQTDPFGRIKKAYRKKALELHPDRNYGNVEQTTRSFAAVQSAYEILSDPQERAWYDTHREAILRNRNDASGEHFDHNVRVTTADDILRMFTRFHGKMEFSDSATGFYRVLRESFGNLAREEDLACEWEGLEKIEYPSFGHANDSYESVVRSFYAMWNGFATKKTFSWMDTYRYSDAPDRRVRRMMEKENKRFREEGVREFNDAVRSLVAFVKKRDPRFKPNVQTETEKRKTLRDAAHAQAARSRAANQAKYTQVETIPEWMKSGEIQEDDLPDKDEEIVSEQFECVVCQKTFKSERQYEAHEKSKKHVKAVQHLRRQMKDENENLKLNEISEQSILQPITNSTVQSSESGPASWNEVTSGRTPTAPGGHNGNGMSGGLADVESTASSNAEFGELQDEAPMTIASEPVSASENDEYAPRTNVEERIVGGSEAINEHHTSEVAVDDISEKLASESLQGEKDQDTQPKLGKAKEKRARKAAQKSSLTAGSGPGFKCASCQAAFPSKTRLFNHIKDFGHAQPAGKPMKGGKGKK